MANILLEVEAVPGNRQKLVLTMTDEGIDISGTSFGWPEINRVRYRAVDRYHNGSYMGTTFSIAVANTADESKGFVLESSTTGFLKGKIDHERRDRNRVEWGKAVDILEERVCVRLMTEALATVLEGGAVEFAGLRLDPQGIHKDGFFSKSVAWQDVAGTKNENSYLRILARKGNKTKKVIELHHGNWNVVLLPRMINALTSRMV
jgi:hypothetical protein